MSNSAKPELGQGWFVEPDQSDLPPWQIKSAPLAAANQRDGQITSDFQKSCQAPKSKIFLFSLGPNQFTDSRRLVPPEGRLAIVTNAGRDAMDAAARETNAACWRTAKSCRSGAPMQASSLADFPRGDGETSAVTGENAK
jgi:hypothetical protein